MGECITCIRVTPNNRRVLARTLGDRIAAVDVSFFAATHSFDCGRGGGGGRAWQTSPDIARTKWHSTHSTPSLLALNGIL